jgi:uncharacterized protein (DUF433 family)
MSTGTLERGGAIALRHRLLTLRETMVLAGIVEKEKEIRNDISRGVLSTANVVRSDNARVCFGWPHVVIFAAVYGNRFIDSAELRRVAIEKAFAAARGGREMTPDVSYGDWHRFISDCVSSRTRVSIDNYLEINLGKACNDVRPRMTLYADGLSRVEENDAVLGGAAVFCGTRVSVLHIGKMAGRGANVRDILEDYPSLTEADVEFAKLYYTARPPVGRPPAVGVKQDVEHGNG